MRPADAPPLPDRVVVGMFHSSPRLRRVEPLLRWCPRWLGEATLAGLAVADGLRRGRYRRARAWAAAQPGAASPPWRVALTLLANHGRFCAEEALVGVRTTAAPAADVVVEGAEHLPAPGTGAILLGFHLGPPRMWYHLRTLGYPVRLGGALVTSIQDRRWQGLIDSGEVVYIPGGATAGRLPGLFQIRELLRRGEIVYLAADGTYGREAFRVELPGGPLIVRTGWLVLRRMTRAATLPVFIHRDGRRRVIVIHPPLPAPVPGADEDAAACHAVLAPLIGDYVRRFPTQCRYLAFPPWSTAPLANGATLDREEGSTYSPTDR
jgi:lauroyl/myristoyl acyltransferase